MDPGVGAGKRGKAEAVSVRERVGAEGPGRAMSKQPGKSRRLPGGAAGN